MTDYGGPLRALISGDRDGFIASEADTRRDAGMPPYGRLAALVVSGPDAAQLDDFTRKLARAAPRDPAIQVLGPAPAPLALLRGRHRRRFLVKAARTANLHAVLRDWLSAVAPHGGIRRSLTASFIRFTDFFASAYVSSGKGPISPGRWHSAQRFCSTGATSR